MRMWVRSLALVFTVAVVASAHAGVRDTLHNLSASGPGNVRAQFSDQICEFCHMSHSTSSRGPLWARAASAATYKPYSSSTAVARPGQPTGNSVLCLSCHDGTIALGKVLNRGVPHSMAGGMDKMPRGKGLQGTDLSDDHPISFPYTATLAAQNGELVPPSAISRLLRIDRNGELQCTTCHDAHDSPYGKLLRMENTRSRMCTECHRKAGWEQSSHSLSDASWNGMPPDPWRDSQNVTVAENGCNNCHVPHSAGGNRLLKYAAEEDNCSDCHNGNVATKNVLALFKEPSAHRLTDTTAVHDPAEPAVVTDRHVECADCHDPHATSFFRSAGDTPANVRGVNLIGTEVASADRVFEICLRCHGDSQNQPPSRTPRQHDQVNMRLKIQPDNPSFHPIAGPGRNPDVPSLLAPLTEQSIMTCTDCHNSSSAVSVGGSGPEGPHGSRFEPILSRNYTTLDNTAESAFNYALCYGCHSRNSILSDESFSQHDKHIRGENTPCNACHDPHGISSTQGNLTNNSHLINFDTTIVSPNSMQRLIFTDSGDRTGSCDLLCHGEDHDNYEY